MKKRFCLIACCFIIATSSFAQKVRLLFRDTNTEVSNSRFSPDEKYIFISPYDGPSKLYETATGKFIGHFKNGATDFSRDGKYVVVSRSNEPPKIFELLTAKLVLEINDHPNEYFKGDFSPDGRYVITASLDKTVAMTETATGKLIRSFVGHTDIVSSVEFSPDGKYVVTTSDDATAKIWETSTGKLIQTLTGHSPNVHASFSPNGTYIVTASYAPYRYIVNGKDVTDRSDKTARIWETATGKLIQTITNIDGPPIFSPDGTFILIESLEQTTKIWETATGKLVHNLKGYIDDPSAKFYEKFSPDGKYIVTGPNQTTKIWETATGKLIRALTANSEITFSLDGNIYSDGDRVWEMATGKLIAEHKETYNDLSPDLKYMVTRSDNDHVVKIRETITNKLIKDFTNAFAANFSPSGKYITILLKDKAVEVWEISSVPKPTAPANLEVKSILFSDQNGNRNNILDANEKANIGFVVTNSGKGNAYNLIAEIKTLNTINGVEYSNQNPIGNLASGESAVVNIPTSGTLNVESGTVDFEIQIKEANGFDADPIRISFNTQKFKEPLVTIADYKFSTDGGKIKLGQLITLEIVLQNKGQGDASNIKVSFNNPVNVFPGSETNFAIDKLKPNESQKFGYEFFANKMYTAKEISIEVSVTESYNQYGDKRTLNVSLEQTLSQTQTVTIAGQIEKPVQIESVSLRSEVDTNIPITEKKYNNRYALVIGNEDYKKYQTGLKSDQNVLFARNDAAVFKEYLVKTMGVPEKQTFILTDATRAQMNRELERVIELAKLTPNAELIFYYAGHGLPDIETQKGYLIPVDVTVSNLKDAISLKDLYSKLASSKATKVLVFLDACFSGGGRGENGLLAARSVKIKPKGDIVEGNIVAFTAASGEEVSLPLNKEYHGLFTYHVLRKLKDTQGELTLEQLKSYLESEIPKASLIENGIKQTPQVLASPDLNDKWLSWKIQN